MYYRRLLHRSYMFISPTKTRKQEENTEVQGRTFLFMFERTVFLCL